MEKFELIATTTFGLEAVVKRELMNLELEVTRTENGKVYFIANKAGIVKANLWLRCADRVLLKVGEFKAETFDELFEKTKELNWSDLIPKNGKIPVDGQSVKSKLFSISDSQAIVKKAIVENLKEKYQLSWFPENGAVFNVKVSILKDIATLTIDTSGVALHKRGYRKSAVTAPLKETLAAALVYLSFWNEKRVLIDPFCGSGTIPIEAAMIARNIAPGLGREFAFKDWPLFDDTCIKEETRAAYKAMKFDLKLRIEAYDISEENIEAAISNAEDAGVLDAINYKVQDFYDIEIEDDYQIIITNPPYGERLSERDEVRRLYIDIGKRLGKLEKVSTYIITSDENFETVFKRKADRRRKLYNGKIKVIYYQFYGQRPVNEIE